MMFFYISIFRKIMHLCLYVFLLVRSTLLSAQTSPTPEYKVKAAFIFNFTQFVEWPAASFSSAKAPIIIGVLGNNPFGSYLEEAVTGEKVNGHPLIIQYYKNIQDIKKCQILFINMEETDMLEDSIASLKKRCMLTISNGPDFTRQEEIIRFFIENNKTQFQINQEAAKESNLVISSKLLKLAKIYIPQKNN